MKIPHCHREQEVLDAVRSGRWSGAWGEEIRTHAAACPVCSEVALVAEAMIQEHHLEEADVRLPSAGLVWWKAQLAARRSAEARATQPIALAERFAQGAALLTALGLAFWQWPRISGWLGGVTKLAGGHNASSAVSGDWTDRIGRVLQTVAQGLGGQSSGYLMIASVGALLALMAFAAYVVLREE